MRRYDHTLRLQIRHLIRRQFYKNYKKHLCTMTDTDPFILSHDLLDRLLSFVGNHNEYYAGLVSEHHDFSSLPLLTKNIIRQKFESLKSTGQRISTYQNASGGSTGEPVFLIQDETFTNWSEATHGYYFQEFLGIERDSVRSVWLWGWEGETLKLETWLHKIRRSLSLFSQNRLFLNTFYTNEQRWLEYIEKIRTYRPYYVAGYAGSLYQIARVARKCNIRLYTPRFVYSSAEMLRDFMRKEIEEQFDAKVYDFYGSREVGAIAGECSAGRMHVFIMNNIVEVLDDMNQPVDSFREGRFAVTNLHNYSMPMIRYEIGDTGSISHDRCVCGSQLPILDKLTGRVTDHFYSRNGAQIHGEFFTHLFYFRNWIEQFQVDQIAHDHLRISVVPNMEINEHDMEDINTSIRTAMGKDCTVEWLYVESIDKTPYGKHLFTRCLIGESE